MDCELCGKTLNSPRKAVVEGSILNVCDNCVRFGEEVQFSRPAAPSGGQASGSGTARKVSMPYSAGVEENGRELVEDYGKLIQQKWRESGKKLEEFSAMLNERSSMVSKLISQSMIPDEKLAKKLEHKLNIRLYKASAEPI